METSDTSKKHQINEKSKILLDKSAQTTTTTRKRSTTQQKLVILN